ncbi:uncharacterized protein LOC105199697 [Solenopsis invicta]|uniref:uncharacterized protein LOC105199697 n=1 Tax=Solenopsis invicta TaxID=13686 RepID=UPI000595D92A|nr:uncharacterized protein LOC105199697 [Solenopsis invicta]
MAELCLFGLDDMTGTQEVAEILAAAGGCALTEVQVGTVRRPRSGLGSVWVRCPAASGRKLVETGKIRICWVMAGVEALSARPMMCFRCLKTDHTIGGCVSPIDRSGRCYRCDGESHVAGQCQEEKIRCPLCTDLGLPAGHRLGGPSCTPPPKRKVRGSSGVKPAKSPKNGPGPIAVENPSGGAPLSQQGETQSRVGSPAGV